jgi:hypothetical protein
MTLCHEDGTLVGNTALDAVAKVTELHGEAELLLVRVELIVDAGGVIDHVVAEGRGYSSGGGANTPEGESTKRRGPEG